MGTERHQAASELMSGQASASQSFNESDINEPD
jgi:hypothetical protein